MQFKLVEYDLHLKSKSIRAMGNLKQRKKKQIKNSNEFRTKQKLNARKETHSWDNRNKNASVIKKIFR